MSKHTQGPWASSDLDFGALEHWEAIDFEITSPKKELVIDGCIAPSFNGDRCEEKIANARLIAVAPEMYDVCVQLVSARDSCDPPELKNAYFAALHIINKLKVQDNE